MGACLSDLHIHGLNEQLEGGVVRLVGTGGCSGSDIVGALNY